MFRPGHFEELCFGGKGGVEVGSVQQIEMDIHRTMPNNVFFGGNGPGIVKLERVLIAFSRHNPSIGYCQGSTFPQPLSFPLSLSSSVISLVISRCLSLFFLFFGRADLSECDYGDVVVGSFDG